MLFTSGHLSKRTLVGKAGCARAFGNADKIAGCCQDWIRRAQVQVEVV